MSKAKDNSASGLTTEIYERARWKHWMRFIGLTLMICLNVSLVGSSIEIHVAHKSVDFSHELASYAVAILFNVVILIPILFEVDRLWVAPDKLILKTLLWQSKVPFEEIVSFTNPIYLAFAIIKTRHCFYMVNKRDFPNFYELAQIITDRIGKTGKA